MFIKQAYVDPDISPENLAAHEAEIAKLKQDNEALREKAAFLAKWNSEQTKAISRYMPGTHASHSYKDDE